jgi:hypothetical protein
VVKLEAAERSDGRIVISGSFNFSTAAEQSNAGNLIGNYDADLAQR